MKILKQSITLLLAVVLMVSCNSGEKKSSNNTSKEVDLNEIIKAADAITPEISSVDDVFKTLDLAEAQYFPMLCNDPYNASNYMNTKSVAASNLGIYVTDIVYHMYGDATEDMFLTFGAAQELSQTMGLAAEFGATLLTELEGGSVSRDSLVFVFNGLMEESEIFNSAEEMMHIHTAFLAGLYIEKLYITSSLLSQSLKKTDPSAKELINYKKLLVVFNKQLQSADVLMGSLGKHGSQLKELFNIQEFASLKSAANTLKTNLDALLNAEELKPTSEISTISEAISKIRTRIVSAS